MICNDIICNDYHRKEDEKQKRGEFKDERNRNGHLTNKETYHVLTPAKCTNDGAGAN